MMVLFKNSNGFCEKCAKKRKSLNIYNSVMNSDPEQIVKDEIRVEQPIKKIKRKGFWFLSYFNFVII